MAARSENSGIVVLGAPRSGTTLLRRILNAHPNIACPGETNLFTGLGRFLRQEVTIDGTPIGALSGLSFMGVERERVIDDLRNFAYGYLRDYARAHGKARWAEKTAFNAFYLKELRSVWSDDTVFLVIVRHGLDVACSIQELCQKNGMYLQELREYLHTEPTPLLAFAQAWSDLTESLLDFQEERVDRAYLLKYEDLVTQPDSVLADTFAFLGEDWRAPMLQEALSSFMGVGLGDWKTYTTDAVSRKSIDRWRRMPANLVARTTEIVNSTLVRCDYEPVEKQAICQEPDQRRYELALLLGRLNREQDE